MRSRTAPLSTSWGFVVATYWAGSDGAVPSSPLSWPAAAGVALTLVANVARSVSVAAEAGATLAYGVANFRTGQRVMSVQAGREIEALTSGEFWDGDDDAVSFGFDDEEEE